MKMEGEDNLCVRLNYFFLKSLMQLMSDMIDFIMCLEFFLLEDVYNKVNLSNRYKAIQFSVSFCEIR